jgi:CDP-paratose 2-epimerase
MSLKNKKILITGSLGLIGFTATNFFLEKGYSVIGVDNNLREKLFSVETNFDKKISSINSKYYQHYSFDIREKEKLAKIFSKHKDKITLIIHTAAQTSHDWSAKEPITDFWINALGTLYLLKLYLKYCPKAIFIFTSTNKVYGDKVNNFDFKELKTRYDLSPTDQYYQGISEDFSIDQSTHSPFGVSKTSADLLVQEYGRYFGLKTGVFRLGVVAGSGQSGSFYQGFLSFMLKKLKNDEVFTVVGYKGKQVRDIIHAKDVVSAFYYFYKKPRVAEVFNLGGGRENSVSVLELIEKINQLTGKKLKTKYETKARKGDHQWWITNYQKFKRFYPDWKIEYSINDIICDIYQNEI